MVDSRDSPSYNAPVNNLAYGNQDTASVSGKLAEIVKEETGTDPQYIVRDEGASPTTAKTVVLEGLDLLFGGKKATNLFTVDFDLGAPRPMTINVPVARQGVGCHAGPMLFTTPIRGSITQEITLKPGKFLSGPKFEGDPASAKLTANGDLMKKVKDFQRTKANIGGVDIEIPPSFRIVPDADQGALLVVTNMPKMLKMGFAVTLEIKQFADIAAAIESSL